MRRVPARPYRYVVAVPKPLDLPFDPIARAAEIGQRLMVHPTSVTNTINRLEQQRLVIRRPNPLDGRGTLAEITPAGREVVERATADLMAADFGMAGYDRAPPPTVV